MTHKLLVVHALSPLHAGTGQSTAAVDLPIARDRATDLPLLPGSSIKGALRSRARGTDSSLERTATRVFGPETEHASDHAGAVVFTDARLLLLPVRSVAGTFAWVTSPLLLAWLRRLKPDLPKPPALPLEQEVAQVRGRTLKVRLEGGDKVVLEEFDLTPADLDERYADALSHLVFPGDKVWGELLRDHLCIVHDDVMSFFATHATEVVTRVSIDPETGTAKKGQLWTEENLPAESVLVGLVEEVPTATTTPSEEGAYLAFLGNLVGSPIQLGGKATVGRGRCQLRLV